MSDPIDVDSELDAHIVFFDRNRDGEITAEEIKAALVELGFRPFTASLLTPVLALLPSSVDEQRSTRHDDSGSFMEDGSFNDAAFEAWWTDVDRDGSGDATRWELFRASLRLSNDPVSAVASVAEFQLVHGLLAEDGRLTRASVLEFLNGDLFRRLIAARGDPAT